MGTRALLLLISASSALGQRLFTPDDLLTLKNIGDLQPSPESRSVLFTLDSDLVRVSANGGDPQPVPGSPKGVSDARWSPDGRRIAFIRENAVWTLDVAGGKLTRVCDYYRSSAFLSKAGNMLSWSPDGAEIAFAGSLEPPPPPGDPIVVTRILYKGRTAIADGRRTHLYVVSAAGGPPRALTSGDTDEHSIDWSGD